MRRSGTIKNRIMLVAVAIIAVSAGISLYFYGRERKERSLPVTTIALSQSNPIINIRSWRICGPFVLDANHQVYSRKSESDTFDRDFLAWAGGRESSLTLPSRITNVSIDFARDDEGKESDASESAGVFLNQNVYIPTPNVSSQLLFWHSYRVFKVLYAAAELDSSSDQDVTLLAAADSPVKVWVNDIVQFQSEPGSVGAEAYDHAGAKVHLRAGKNTILVKLMCFPLHNGLSVSLGTPEAVRRLIDEHGGVLEVSTQLIIDQGKLLKLSPVLALYDSAPSNMGHYWLKDVSGRVVIEGSFGNSANEYIDVSRVPDGLYALNVEKGTLNAGELLFRGDLQKRFDLYRARCGKQASQILPCEALPALVKASTAAGADFRIDNENLLVLLIAQLESAIQDVPPRAVFANDYVPRVRLASFHSKWDGSLQYYYFHLPTDLKENEHPPMVVTVPDDDDGPFFESAPTTNPIAQQRYARFADDTHMSVIMPFAHGKLPAAIAEEHLLEAIEDATSRLDVDGRRIYLVGHCAGGNAALLFAESNSERFAAVATHQAATGFQTEVSDPAMDSANALLRLRNLGSMSIGLFHGKDDYHSPTDQAFALMKEAAKVGVYPKLTLLDYPEAWGPDDPDQRMFDFLAARNAQTVVPDHLALTVTEMSHNHMFWITVDQLRDQGTLGYISADLDSADESIKIDSTNVSQFTVDTRKMPSRVTGKKSWRIVVKGQQERYIEPDSTGRIVMKIAHE